MVVRACQHRNLSNPAPPSDDPIWLTHHHPAHHDRCLVVAGRRVCRRCLVLYPIAFCVMAASLAGVHWPGSWDGLLMLVLPAPAIAEFVAEHTGRLSHRPRRQVALTLVAAPALGRGLARYLETPADRLWWTMVVGYGLVGLAATLLSSRDRTVT